jgi:hypothetical protein
VIDDEQVALLRAQSPQAVRATQKWQRQTKLQTQAQQELDEHHIACDSFRLLHDSVWTKLLRGAGLPQ